jgi:crossover junction endodeoxyribonuclease RusA
MLFPFRVTCRNWQVVLFCTSFWSFWKMLEIFLPFPPSVNVYWGFSGSRRFLTNKAKAFKTAAKDRFAATGHQGLGKARLSVSMTLHAPDKRVRDIDNVVKSTLDALCQAGVFADDGQVDVLLVQRSFPMKGGMCVVKIEEIISPPVANLPKTAAK